MKKKIVVFTLPAMGHTVAPSSLVKELEQYYDVYVFTSAKYTNFYNTSKVNIYKIDEKEFYFDRSPIYLTEHILNIKDIILKDNLIKEITEGADYVIYDIYAFWGKDLAQNLKKPNISYGITYSQNFTTFLPASLKRSSLNYFLKSFKDGKNIFLKNPKNALKIFKNILPNYSENHISLIPEFLQPPFSKNKNHFYVCDFDFNKVNKNKNNYVYVALGTIYLDKDLLIKIISVLKELGVKATVSVGIYLKDLENFGDEKIKIVDFSNQEEELKNANLFITHAGTNSVIQAISNLVPMICFPQAVDQFAFANRVEKLGLGVYIGNQNIENLKLKKIIQNELNNKNRSNNFFRLFKNSKNFVINDAILYIRKIFV